MTGAKTEACDTCCGTGRRWHIACDDCLGEGRRVICAEPLCGERFTIAEARVRGFFCEACRNVLDEPEALHEAS